MEMMYLTKMINALSNNEYQYMFYWIARSVAIDLVSLFDASVLFCGFDNNNIVN